MLKKILHYICVVIGCLIAAGSINVFLVQHHLLSGGLAGIGIISYYLFGLPAGTVTLALNVPLLIAAWRMLGKKYVAEVLFATVMFSVCLDATEFLSHQYVTDDILLAAIYGGVFNGIGFGILFRVGANSGGMDIAAAIVKKYYSFNMGEVVFGINCCIMILAAFLFGPAPAMYTLISMFIAGRVSDMLAAGFNHRKAVIIISQYPEQIADGIIHRLERGATFLNGAGAFYRDDKKVVFSVVRMTEIARLKNLIYDVDPTAFMIFIDANEVMGRGFTLSRQTVTDARAAGDSRLIGSRFDDGQ